MKATRNARGFATTDRHTGANGSRRRKASPLTIFMALYTSIVLALSPLLSNYAQAQTDLMMYQATITQATNEATATEATESSTDEGTVQLDAEEQQEDSVSTESAKATTKKKLTGELEVKLDEEGHTRTYKVQVVYGEDANIPDGSEIEITELEETDERKDQERQDEAVRILDLGEKERVLQHRFLKIAIKADGYEIQPAAPVDVTVTTKIIAPAQSDAVEVVLMGKDDGEALETKNLTGIDNDGNEIKDPSTTRVRFVTSRFGDLDFCVVVAPRYEYDLNGTMATVWGPRNTRVDVAEHDFNEDLGEGRTLVRTLTMAQDPAHERDSALWVSIADDRADEDKVGVPSAYLMVDGQLADKPLATVETDQPAEFFVKDELAFVWDEATEEVEETEVNEETEVQPSEEPAGGTKVVENQTTEETEVPETPEEADDEAVVAQGEEVLAAEGTLAMQEDGDQPAEGSEGQTQEANIVLDRLWTGLEGSWASWKVIVNSQGATLNTTGDSTTLTLEDTFDDKVEGDATQSIDYASVSIKVNGSPDTNNTVTYDYRSSTGTFVIPDGTPVEITYRTRITAQPGERKLFRGTAVLKNAVGDTLATSTAGEMRDGVVIYPSASDVAGFGTDYMLNLYVYADGQMQTGVPGAQFILLDASQRPMEYKVGENKGQPVLFMTDKDGKAQIMLDEESGDVTIEKNTAYYLEMIQAPQGYQKDNTLYGFMITDDPDYNSGSFLAYHNGDTLKVRLYAASPGLDVSLRFSGNYALSTELKNEVEAILQRKIGNDWENVELHSYDESVYGTIEFTTTLDPEQTYRVIEQNQRPWDLPDNVGLVTKYYYVDGSGSSDPYDEPQEFYVTSSDDSMSVVIDNRYEERELRITKMDKSTGKLLSGAIFTVRKAVGDEEVTTYTTGNDGQVLITGGEPYVSEVLYYVVETKAPDGYVLPKQEERHYFYFCNDKVLEPTILADLPEGETATNLTETYDDITVDNQKLKVTVPVMKLWQGGTWPSDVQNVTIGLYQSIDGGDPIQVTDENGEPRTVTLNSTAPYNNTAFTNLPTRIGDDLDIDVAYSVKEEKIDDKTPLEAGYVQEYGTSSAGVYVVRNKPAATLTVSKEWYENGTKVTNASKLAQQSRLRSTCIVRRIPSLTVLPMTALRTTTWKPL